MGNEYVRRGLAGRPPRLARGGAEVLSGGGSQQRFQNGVLREFSCQTGFSPSLTYLLGFLQ